MDREITRRGYEPLSESGNAEQGLEPETERVRDASPEGYFMILDQELQQLRGKLSEDIVLILKDKLEALKYAYFVDGQNLTAAMDRFESSVKVLQAEIGLLQKQVKQERAKVEPEVKLRQSQIEVLGVLQQVLEGGGINNRDLANVYAAFEAEQALETPGLALSPESVLGALERNITIPRYRRILEMAGALVNSIKPEVEEIIKMRQADKSPEDQLWDAKKERAEILSAIASVDTDPLKNPGETDQKYAYKVTALHRQRNEYVRAYKQLATKIARLEAEIYQSSGKISAEDTATLPRKTRGGGVKRARPDIQASSSAVDRV